MLFNKTSIEYNEHRMLHSYDVNNIIIVNRSDRGRQYNNTAIQQYCGMPLSYI